MRRSLERILPFRRKAKSRFRTGAKHSTEKKIGFRSARGHHSRRTLIRVQRQGQECARPHPSLRLPVVGGIEDNLGPHRSTNHSQKRRVINDCLDLRYSLLRSLRYDVDIWGLQGWTIYDSETWIAAFSVESRVFERDYHRPS